MKEYRTDMAGAGLVFWHRLISLRAYQISIIMDNHMPDEIEIILLGTLNIWCALSKARVILIYTLLCLPYCHIQLISCEIIQHIVVFKK